MKKVAVLGMGYVGFPLACAIAKSGKYEVIGIDPSKDKIKKINKGISPVEDEQAEKDIKEIKIEATDDFKKIKTADFVLICVPTPIDENRDPDLTPVRNASEEVAKNIKKGQVIILESTVNPGVSRDEVLPILEKSGLKGGKDFDLAHCPERINPGDPKWNVYNINRNIGATSPKGTKKSAEFYRSFIKAEVNEMSSLEAAEATKVVENTFRDINIAYVNELAMSFDKMGLDVVEVINGAKNKPFAFMAHYPSCGVGGHCIPVDPYYLIQKAQTAGFDHKFLRMGREVNNLMPRYTVDKLMEGLNEIGLALKGRKIAVLGLSYKANLGDMRESPAVEIFDILKKYDCELRACDPYVEDQKDLHAMDDLLNWAEAVVIGVNHSEFMSIDDWRNIKVIVDGKNCLDKNAIKKKKIVYRGIGRK